MNWSFLNPWMWLAIAGMAAPVWLHLKRKHETNLVKFSAVKFLLDQPEPSKTPLQLQNILLLILRVLALLLLISAFAWPFVRKKNNAIVSESRVYILDNTLSHQVDGGFQKDRDRLLSEISGAGQETQIAVVELTSMPRIVVNFGDDRESSKQRIKELEASCQRGSFLAAFRQANSLLVNSLGQRKRIIILTDNQMNQWSENEGAPPFLQDIEVEIPKASTSLPVNISLSDPRVQRIFLGDKSLVNFMANLSNQGRVNNAEIVLRVNDQEILRKPINFPDEAGTTIVQAQWDSDPSLWIRGELSIESESDALAPDNKLYFSTPPVEEGRILLLAKSKYLRVALSPDVMKGRWVTRVIEPAQLGSETQDPNCDVLCIESDYLQSSHARQLLNRYLSSGKGVLLLMNRVTLLSNAVLKELGFEIDSAKSIQIEPQPKHFNYYYGGHPIFQPFLSSDFGNLGEIKVYQHASFLKAQAVPLIYSETGDALFFESQKNAGKLYVSAFGFQKDQSNWPMLSTFIPFLDLCMQQARPQNTNPTQFEPGEVCVMKLSPDIQSHELVLKDKARELQRVPVVENQVRFRVPVYPGMFTLSDPSVNKDWILCVNPPTRESDLKYTSVPAALQAWKLSANNKNSSDENRETAGWLSRNHILQQRYWWWLLSIGLIALGLETFWVSLKKS